MSIILVLALIDAGLVLSRNGEIEKAVSQSLYASCSSQRTRRTLFDAIVDVNPGINFVGATYSDDYPTGDGSPEYAGLKARLSCDTTDRLCLGAVRREMDGHLYDLPILFCLSRMGDIKNWQFIASAGAMF